MCASWHKSLPRAKAGQGLSYSRHSTNGPSSKCLSFYCQLASSLFLSVGATSSHAIEPLPQPIPLDVEPPPSLPQAVGDDARGIPSPRCLAKSPASLCPGGGCDTSFPGVDDAADARADDDYVADITTAREAWDPRSPQDWGSFWSILIRDFLVNQGEETCFNSDIF